MAKKKKKAPARGRVTKSKRKKAKKIAVSKPKARAKKKKVKMAMAAVLVTEKACQTGAWIPSKSANQQVAAGSTLGQVIFSGIACDVTASVAGVITWIEISTQVNMDDDVCTIA